LLERAAAGPNIPVETHVFAAMQTFAPARASLSATANPIPRLPPLQNTVGAFASGIVTAMWGNQGQNGYEQSRAG
jgi:hypothetical protein